MPIDEPVAEIETLAFAEGQRVAEPDAFAQGPGVAANAFFGRRVAGIQITYPLDELAVGEVLDDDQAMSKALLYADVEAVVIRFTRVVVLLRDSCVLRKWKQ
jgi:hypothetical protein